ncbi:hypothetical protein Tco_0775499 [Tanacetum coccineum]
MSSHNISTVLNSRYLCNMQNFLIEYGKHFGNSPKRLGKMRKENTIVHPCSLDEHVAVQREMKLNQVHGRPDNDDITEVSKSTSLCGQKLLGIKNKRCYGVKTDAAPTHLLSVSCSSAQSLIIYINRILRRRQDEDTNYNNQQLPDFDSKVRYSAFKVTEVKTDEPKALVSVDSIVNWSDHAAENKTAAAEFGMMGISPKFRHIRNAVKNIRITKRLYHINSDCIRRKDWILSANLENTTKHGYTGKLHDQAQKGKRKNGKLSLSDIVDLKSGRKSSKNLEMFMYQNLLRKVKPLHYVCQGWGECMQFPPSITRKLICHPIQSDIEEDSVVSGDKSSVSETYEYCDSLKTKTKDFPPAVDIKTLPESDVEDPNSTAGSPSFSCLENVKSPRIFCNKSGMNNRNVCKNNSVRVKKCFVCGSKLHLIKDCDLYTCVEFVPCKTQAASVPAGSRNSTTSVTADGSDPAASRNRPAVNSAGRPNPAGWSKRPAPVSAGRPNPAGWSKRPAPVSAGRPVSAGWLNPAARPYFRPSSVYFKTTNISDRLDCCNNMRFLFGNRKGLPWILSLDSLERRVEGIGTDLDMSTAYHPQTDGVET